MRAASDKEAVSAASVDYLMYSGYVTLAAHWLRMEAAAIKERLEHDPSFKVFALDPKQTGQSYSDLHFYLTEGRESLNLSGWLDFIAVMPPLEDT